MVENITKHEYQATSLVILANKLGTNLATIANITIIATTTTTMPDYY